METKVCRKCKQEKPVKDFCKYSKSKDGYHYWCKKCQIDANRTRYQTNLETRKKHVKRTRKARRRAKLKAIEYKGGKCQLCGYKKCPAALEFHHIDPSKKDIRISAIGGRKWSIVKKELDKCILLCSNCHREIHYYQDN